MEEKLFVGVGRSDITPQVGSWLMGYAPGRQAQSINDHLYVTVLAFEYAGIRTLIASADVCVINEPLVSIVREQMAAATSVHFEHIIISATHTHSGPAMRETPGGSSTDEQYLYHKFCPLAAAAAAQAVGSLQQAKMGVAEIPSVAGINRRQLNEDGTIGLGQNPYGSYDPIMTVISFTSPDGKPIANLIHYGAHNTASGINPEITRDWCGVMVDRLEAESGGITVFVNGCEGDCGPRLPNGRTTGNLKLAMELGACAGIDAVNAWRSIKEWHDGAAMKVLSEEIPLPLESLPSLDELKKQKVGLGDPDHLVGLKVMEYTRLCERIEIVRSGKPVDTCLMLRQTIISIGPVAFVPIPFEVFSIITLRIRQHSPYPYTISLSNANGSYYYLPSQDQICRGGYEIWVFKAMNAQPFADDTEQYMVSGNIRLLRKLCSR
ncbi:MAG: neutral/alkaline non-lysosomal ceramidase N-terminal domain-containing protein [Bacillota bacterium]|nr:neutral/alkaline non-lysosomal ceramidase N-terminal domain-containing protein [Bacillota bacterium]